LYKIKPKSDVERKWKNKNPFTRNFAWY
jgi:hypothetical protein